MKSFIRSLAVVPLLWVLLSTATAPAGMVDKAVRRAVTKRAATVIKKQVKKSVGKQTLGPVHRFKKPAVVERYTNRPATDKARGLGGKEKHVFTRRPRVGRRGTAEHIEKELNIPHAVKQREKIVIPPGTKYHERPIKGGEAHMRELIIHGRVPPKAIKVKEKLPHAAKK